MLKTKSIYADVEEDDGMRIAIMIKLQDFDPETRELNPLPQKILDTLHGHDKSFAPSKEDFWAYTNQEIPFREYKKRLQEKLRTPEMTEYISDIGAMLDKKNMTFLCVEEKPRYCHRKIVAEEFGKYFPNLEFQIQ